MVVQKTYVHGGVTLAHGHFQVCETIYVCVNGCKEGKGRVTHGQEAVARLLPPRSTVGYDVMVQVGLLRFTRQMQRDEILTTMHDEHGVSLCSGEVSVLCRNFLLYFEALHRTRATQLRAALDVDGGWTMHVDATGEDGRGTLLGIYDGWHGWLLGAFKIPTEHADAILPKLKAVAAMFGPPRAVVRDLGRAVIDAAGSFVAALDSPVPILSCHLHFLADVGKDLLCDPHNALRDLSRGHDLRSGLRTLARELGRTLDTRIHEARKGALVWLGDQEKALQVPSGDAGLAVVRATAQWALDYPVDGTDAGFPFDLPFLDFYDRCSRVLRSVEAFLHAANTDTKATAALRRIFRILVATREPSFQAPVRLLRQRRELFNELRAALRLNHAPDVDAHHRPASPEARAQLDAVKTAVDRLAGSLRSRRPERGPACDQRCAIDLVLSHLDRHGPSLWGHAIAIGDDVRLVARTNVALEHFWKDLKHGERRRSGRKTLTQDFESLPAAAALAKNLLLPDYVKALCGTLDHLPASFANLDAGQRRSLPARNRALPHDQEVASASMPKADRPIIRASALADRILDAAQSRAPRLPAP
jgi:hypothetical protein